MSMVSRVLRIFSSYVRNIQIEISDFDLVDEFNATLLSKVYGNRVLSRYRN